MAFKVMLFCLSAIIVCAQAKPGGPAAYSISAPSVDHASVGNTQEHTVKGHYGQSSQSDYASQVQTAHSQSHVTRSSSSNDGGYAAAPAIAAHAAYAPAAIEPAHYAVSHTAPAAIATHGLATHGLATHGLATHGLAAHGLTFGHGYTAAAAPAYSYAATAPATALHLSGAHLGYSAAAALPAHGYLAHSLPAVKYAAPAAYAPGIIGHGIGLAAHHGYAAPAYAAPAYAAPAYAAHSYAAPAYAAHIAAPVVKAAVAAPALVHTSVSGHGIHYGY